MIKEKIWSTKEILEAKENPNGWVYEIDFPYRDDSRIPPEAIIGAWKVDENGNLTSYYEENKKYRPIKEVKKELPEYMYAAAKFCKNMWMIEVKKEYEKLFPRYPEEAIVGYWYIDENGVITNKFRPASRND